MWNDIVSLFELLFEASIGWARNLSSFLYALLILYWVISILTFAFAIDYYQDIEEYWFRKSFVESMIWPYAFYEEYNQYHMLTTECNCNQKKNIYDE